MAEDFKSMVEAAAPDATIVMQKGTYVVSGILRIEKACCRSSDPVQQRAFAMHRADPGRPILTVHACKQDLTIEAAAGASGEVIITDPEGADPEVLVLPGVGRG
jgi:hypothetical protein